MQHLEQYRGRFATSPLGDAPFGQVMGLVAVTIGFHRALRS